jgi:geranylgeranyl diphosphate synthase type II
MNLEEYLKEKRGLIDSAITAMIEPLKGSSVLHAAVSYSLMPGGKRLRPILMLSTYHAIKDKEESIIPFACAIEMVHTYSLIHDDLPIVDNSDLRRGRPTTHKVYGSDMALLAGDALLSFAFEIISNRLHLEKFSESALLAVIHEFGVATGIRGLVGGQVMDIVAGNMDSIDEETILYIEEKKTASLISLALRTAGILGGVGEEELKALTDFSIEFGVSYQIIDDILDATSSPEVLGKDTGQDEKNRKATFVALYGVDGAKKMANEFVQKGIGFLSPFDDKYKILAEIAEYTLQRIK